MPSRTIEYDIIFVGQFIIIVIELLKYWVNYDNFQRDIIDGALSWRCLNNY